MLDETRVRLHGETASRIYIILRDLRSDTDRHETTQNDWNTAVL
jgi:hypothetical protein